MDFLIGYAVLIALIWACIYLGEHRGKGDGDVRKGWPVD